MKITKHQLRRIIREEAADCVKDYRLGTLTDQEYEDCLKRFEEPDDYSYRRYPPRKTSYVGADANQDKIIAIQDAIALKPNNFLQSILSQLQRGRGLSSKQNSIVKRIINKSDPEAAKLFEAKGNSVKITKRQLRRIIKEELDVANGDHHWPRVDWSNVGELTDKWIKMEEDAWDKGDTSMNPDDVTDTDAKRHWGDQVEGAAMDMEAELTLRIRRVALQTMKEFSEKLVNGEYS